MPEVFLKAVSVARNFGHGLDGLVTVNVDKESRYRSTVNVLSRPSAEGHRVDGPSRSSAAAVARGRRVRAGASPPRRRRGRHS